MQEAFRRLCELDVATLRFLNPDADNAWVPVFQGISDTTSLIAYGLPIALLLIGIIRRRRPLAWRSIAVLLTVFMADYAAIPLKIWFDRPRPYEVLENIVRYSDGGNASFPSGHTTQAMALAAGLALIFSMPRCSILLITWALLVGLSRVVLGVHYPSDVIGATVLAGVSALLVYKLWRLAASRQFPAR